MHPDPSFALPPDACRGFVRGRGFAHLFVHGPAGAAVIHTPLVPDGEDRLTFHVARRNRAFALLDGARAIASVAGPDGYVSPDWYAGAGQVPTWNYVAVEAEGRIEALSRDALVAQVDALSALHEARLATKPEWTRDKMEPARFEAMVESIAGFVLVVEQWRGTAKLSQNKGAADVAGVVAGLRGAGDEALAALVAGARSPSGSS
ncbi:FMN-binding negative transcriptional regulator [Sphingomonas sp. Leaf412]|uniref:FMN-binding negative transcriptional regulator n=1 Tax=Sphingomonas sp. Leaf412 TaxID=1736370 RepID=UPI0009E676FD|nr:FMN-binding negative transcriptional regulator [Sphingomonas sp. Leaf412]